MTEINRMREQFETAVKAKWPGIRMLRVNRPGSPVDGEYELPGLEGAWWGWQASRAAVVVTLSRITGHEYDPLADADYREGCREAIEAQGLKVKP